MSERGIRKGDRFRWWNSDRSGFQFGFQPLTAYPNPYTRESGRPVRDNGIQISPDEYDQPPPSTKPLGGEGEIGTGARSNSDPSDDANVYIVPSESLIPVQYLSASSQIRPTNENEPVYIVGSNVDVTLLSNPQLVSGMTNQSISLMCVGSSVTLSDGNGLVLNTPAYRMESGSILNLFYGTGWFETSRGTLFE